ncbi:NAD(P)-dependent oxidoreductase [Poriferisphaera sp. WC338]|uniref:NAD(P)-dependent oxidoreductase n=1 Tax=Poriferisphaera sp. WC338 TaxID=3425129 RepID=UPI003D812C70
MSAENKIEHVGFVGMGIMGEPMARNLLRAGFQVSVWNRTRSKCDAIEKDGAKVCDSVADVARSGAQVVCLCVTNTKDVEAVLFGEEGLAVGADEGLVISDHSTIDALAAKDFAERLKEMGVSYLDAPVSGGDVGAKAGTLAVMVGGDEGAYCTVRQVLEAMGKSIMHVGESGMGQVCKSCNQIMVSCNLMGLCEAISLAEKSGLDVLQMMEAVGGGAAGSWQLANLGGKIAACDDSPGFMVKDMLKDLGIAGVLAAKMESRVEGMTVAEDKLKDVADSGGERLGTQSMRRVYGIGS